MKYLAILKDSLREALDSKVLYFTVGLSCLVIAAVASISYRPQPAEQGLRACQAAQGGGGDVLSHRFTIIQSFGQFRCGKRFRGLPVS